MQFNRVAPIWQRVICGVLCAAGIVALLLNALNEHYRDRNGLVSILLSGSGIYLFGYIALCGTLPGKLFRTK
jgi:hypothetical protein